jgi:hypothetical protein
MAAPMVGENSIGIRFRRLLFHSGDFLACRGNCRIVLGAFLLNPGGVSCQIGIHLQPCLFKLHPFSCSPFGRRLVRLRRLVQIGHDLCRLAQSPRQSEQGSRSNANVLRVVFCGRRRGV